MELFAQSRDGFSIRALADHVLYRIAGSYVKKKKNDDHHADQRWNRERKAANYERKQLRLPFERDAGPVLTGEYGRHLEAGDPRLDCVELFIEEEVNHRRVVECHHIRIVKHRDALRFILLPARVRHELVEFRIVVERNVAAGSLVCAM